MLSALEQFRLNRALYKILLLLLLLYNSGHSWAGGNFIDNQNILNVGEEVTDKGHELKYEGIRNFVFKYQE